MIGENLAFFMEKFEMSREMLAKNCAVSKDTISAITNFQQEPGFNTLCELAKGLGIHVDELTNIRKYTDTRIVGEAEIRYEKGKPINN